MKARNMALCGLFASLLAICSWIALPVGDMIFTLQTFGVFLALNMLGGKRGLAAILVYLLLGAVGLPVFSGFRGGFGCLTDVNGGFLWGFLLTAGIYWLITGLLGAQSRLPALLLGLAACYSCGCLWYWAAYVRQPGTLGLLLLKCVLPYLLPDLIKLALAWLLAEKLRRHTVHNP